MLLDAGICGVYHQENIAVPGDKPVITPKKDCDAWFAELDFQTNPKFSTEKQEDVQVDRRIRILQNRNVDTQYLFSINGEKYKVIRAYHGKDEESGELITDLSLQRTEFKDENEP